MKLKELIEKNNEELNRILKESRDKLRESRFKVASRQLKNVREIRKIKKIVIRVLTILSSREKIVKHI